LRAYATESEKQRYGWSKSIPYKTVSKCEPLGYEIKMKKTIVIVDDHVLIAQALTEMIDHFQDFEVMYS
jgi:hypothetical protein